MTANQINNRAQETKAKEQTEQVRHNKQQETIGKVSAAGTVAGGMSRLLGAVNDPSWYSLNEQLVKDVASLSFNLPYGTRSGLPSPSNRESRVTTSVPGILTIRFVTSLGVANGSVASAINVAAKNIYSYVRFANSGARNYDSPDLMMYLLAMDSAYMFYAYLTKLYSQVKKGNAHNWFFPQTVVRAAGGDYDSLVGELAQLRAYINSYAQRISALNVPAVMPFYQRHMWLCVNMFKDGDNVRSQVYQFVPSYLHVYDDVKGALIPIEFAPYANSALTFAKIKDIGEQIISGLMNSEDIGIMSGDILKAYGQEKMFTVDSITEDFDINEIYSEEVLSQINGATVVGDPVTPDDIGINQTTNGFIYQGPTSSAKRVSKKKRAKTQQVMADANVRPSRFIWLNGFVTPSTSLINVPNLNVAIINHSKDDPTPDDNMVATRLSVTGSLTIQTGKSAVYFIPTASGSEYILNLTMYHIDKGAIVATAFARQRQLFQDNVSLVQIYNVVSNMARYNSFSRAPILYVNVFNVNTEKTNLSVIEQEYTSLDIKNYTTVDSQILDNIHSVALQSLFAIPLVGNTNRGKTTSGEGKPDKKAKFKKNKGKGKGKTDGKESNDGKTATGASAPATTPEKDAKDDSKGKPPKK